uniref:Uncharacterized protein n=1 Tax=Anguilla anguilla TaxID=7936 RepID=A0A0E9PKN7_ANGAN
MQFVERFQITVTIGINLFQW